MLARIASHRHVECRCRDLAHGINRNTMLDACSDGTNTVSLKFQAVQKPSLKHSFASDDEAGKVGKQSAEVFRHIDMLLTTQMREYDIHNLMQMKYNCQLQT